MRATKDAEIVDKRLRSLQIFPNYPQTNLYKMSRYHAIFPSPAQVAVMLHAAPLATPSPSASPSPSPAATPLAAPVAAQPPAQPTSNLEALDDAVCCSIQQLQEQNEALSEENAELRAEIIKVRAIDRPSCIPSNRGWMPASSGTSAATEKSYMRPTMASRSRGTAGSQAPVADTDTWERPVSRSVSPRTSRNVGGSSQPGYMQPTAASNYKRTL